MASIREVEIHLIPLDLTTLLSTTSACFQVCVAFLYISVGHRPRTLVDRAGFKHLEALRRIRVGAFIVDRPLLTIKGKQIYRVLY